MSKRTTALLVCLVAAAVMPVCGPASTPLSGKNTMSVVLENSQLRYVISPQGLNTSFVDLATGVDYCQPDPLMPAARARIGDRWHDAAAAAAEDGQVLLGFADTEATARLTTQAHEGYLVLTVCKRDRLL